MTVPASLFTAANTAGVTNLTVDVGGYTWTLNAEAIAEVNTGAAGANLAVTVTPEAHGTGSSVTGVQATGTVPTGATLTVGVYKDTVYTGDYAAYTQNAEGAYTADATVSVAEANAPATTAVEATATPMTLTGIAAGTQYYVAPTVPAEVTATGGNRRVTVSNSVAGITYTVLDNTGAPVGTAQVGNGSTLTFNVTTAGEYTVQASYGDILGGVSRTVDVSTGGGGGTGGGSVIPGGGSTTDPTDPSESNVKLDTQVVYMINEVSLYDFLVTGNNDTDNITVTSSDENVATVAIQDAADTRGAKYRVTTHGTGEATITVTYNGESATMKVVVYPKGGSITLDTVNYKMAPGNIYDIGVTVTDGAGNALSGEQVQQMYQNGTLRVTDSRTGSIVDLTQLPNGNFRVTGKNAGTCWITYEVIQDGVAVTHASVKVDVAAGVTQGGVATRDTSWWADKSADTTTQA